MLSLLQLGLTQVYLDRQEQHNGEMNPQRRGKGRDTPWIHHREGQALTRARTNHPQVSLDPKLPECAREASLPCDCQDSTHLFYVLVTQKALSKCQISITEPLLFKEQTRRHKMNGTMQAFIHLFNKFCGIRKKPNC